MHDLKGWTQGRRGDIIPICKKDDQAALRTMLNPQLGYVIVLSKGSLIHVDTLLEESMAFISGGSSTSLI